MKMPNKENEVLQCQKSSLSEFLMNFSECKICLFISLTGPFYRPSFIRLSRPNFQKWIRQVIGNPGGTSSLDSKS